MTTEAGGDQMTLFDVVGSALWVVPTGAPRLVGADDAAEDEVDQDDRVDHTIHGVVRSDQLYAIATQDRD